MAVDLPDWTSVAVTPDQPLPGSPFSLARDGAFHDLGVFSIPLGCQWIVFGMATPADLANYTVVGQTTGIPYQSVLLASIDNLVYVRIHRALDAQVRIRIQTPNTSGNALFGIAFGFAPTVVDLDPLTGSPVILINDNGVQVATAPSGSGLVNLGVTMVSASPAPWQAAQFSKAIALTIASGAATALGIATIGQQIYLHSFYLSSDFTGAGNNQVQLRGATGHTAFAGGVRSGAGMVAEGDLGGATSPLANGEDVEVLNSAGGAANIIGHLAYSKL